ncbi:MAG: GNAT family N-acetyltransferase [Flavobacteriaceae bacterium]
MHNILETERLILREFNSSDSKGLFELNSDMEVLKYTGDKPFQSELEALRFIENYSDYKKNGFGRWAVIYKDTKGFLGWCGLKLNNDGLVDIGFRFFKKTWNNGLATESAKAVLDYGFDVLNLNEIIGRSSVENKASIRVLEKINMKFWKIENYENLGKTAYYRIHKKSATKLD